MALEETNHPVEKMSLLYGVSRSGYYGWKQHKPSKRAVENAVLTAKIRAIHKSSKQTYGSPRITEVLADEELRVSRPRVARLMKRAGIKAIQPKSFVVTTDSVHDYKPAPNLLHRAFNPQSLSKAWVSDLTYIPTAAGWLYLTIIMDLADRQIIGWSTSNNMQTKSTILAAWKKAVRRREPGKALIFHSDRGVQFCSDEFTRTLKSYTGITQSMSRKGNCWDNAVAESFFATIKRECTNRHRFKTHREAETTIFEYIETWYNTQRKHAALGYTSPKQFENQLLNQIPAA